MRISDWSSDVCSSDLLVRHPHEGSGRHRLLPGFAPRRVDQRPQRLDPPCRFRLRYRAAPQIGEDRPILRADHEGSRSEEHTSELQSLMRISYAVFCLKKKTKKTTSNNPTTQQLQ